MCSNRCLNGILEARRHGCYLWQRTGISWSMESLYSDCSLLVYTIEILTANTRLQLTMQLDQLKPPTMECLNEFLIVTLQNTWSTEGSHVFLSNVFFRTIFLAIVYFTWTHNRIGPVLLELQCNRSCMINIQWHLILRAYGNCLLCIVLCRK